MNTATILIGNSDDKLTQKQWAAFVADIQRTVAYDIFARIHFQGFSLQTAPWQNACWVIEIDDIAAVDHLRSALGRIAQRYNQESIVLVIGNTEFVNAQ